MSECAICGKPELTAVHDHSLETRQAERIRALEAELAHWKAQEQKMAEGWVEMRNRAENTAG